MILVDVGILAAEFYFPPYYVDQTELEQFDNVSAGKYTIGLGQKRMSFCSDVEDVNSMCMTVVKRLLERQQVDPKRLGYLSVGTETIVDKSKSVKSTIMQIFEPTGNTDVGGLDNINACFGGTQALFNAVNWVESSNWDGRLALVIMADIAAYAAGPARCTGGAGALALLIGPNAPLVFDSGLQAFHMCHTYDFYKPVPSSEYPIVDGRLSIDCYLNALDNCFKLYRKKFAQKFGTDPLLDSFAAVLFHAPYCKLVQKSVARLKCSELVTRPELTTNDEKVETFRKNCLKNNSIDSYEKEYKSVEKTFVEYSKPFFEEKTHPSLHLAENLGNTYTASLYAGLLSLFIKKPFSKLAGTRLLMFSYGSGSCSCMFSMRVSPDYSSGSSLTKFCQDLTDIQIRLDSRRKMSPAQYTDCMTQREEAYGKAPYSPRGQITQLYPGTYHLVNIDDKYRRAYARVKSSSMNGCPNSVVENNEKNC